MNEGRTVLLERLPFKRTLCLNFADEIQCFGMTSAESLIGGETGGLSKADQTVTEVTKCA